MENVHSFEDINQINAKNNPAVLMPRDNTTNTNDSNSNNISGFFTTSYFRLKTICSALIIINTIAYISELIFFYAITSQNEWGCVLYSFGAKYTPSIRYNFAIWRLFAPMILHADTTHIIMNTLSIVLMGYYVEAAMQWNKIKFLSFYIICGFYALLFSTILDVEDLGVGASGAIMGLSGFLITLFSINYSHLSHREKNFFLFFLLMTLANLFQSAYGQNKIDNYAHFGGFITGLMLSLFYLNTQINNIVACMTLIGRLKICSFFALILIPIVWLIAILTIKVPLNYLDFLCKSK